MTDSGDKRGYDPGSNSMPPDAGGGWPPTKLSLTPEFDLRTRTRYERKASDLDLALGGQANSLAISRSSYFFLEERNDP